VGYKKIVLRNPNDVCVETTPDFQTKTTTAEIHSLLDAVFIPGDRHPWAIDFYEKHLKQAIDTNAYLSGAWLLSSTHSYSPVDTGFYALHWPTLFEAARYHHDLNWACQRVGLPIRSQHALIRSDPEAFQELVQGYKTILRHTLPPGCLLEADNDLLRRAIAPFVPRSQLGLVEGSPIRDSLGLWTFFRLGTLARTKSVTYKQAVSAYSSLATELISQVLTLREDLPIVVRVLLQCMRHARLSEGVGAARWGMFWTKSGLVFDYGLGLHSLSIDDPVAFREVVSSGDMYEALGLFLDPYSYRKRSFGGVPELQSILSQDTAARKVVVDECVPYEAFFEDGPFADSRYMQLRSRTNHRLFFPISLTDKRDNLLTYVQKLHAVTLQRQANLTKYASLYTLNKTSKPVVKSEPTLAAKPIFSHKINVATFNRINLGATRAPQPFLPFEVQVAQLKGQAYCSMPKFLTDAYPELLYTPLFDRECQSMTLHWAVYGSRVIPGLKHPVSDMTLSQSDVIYTTLGLPRAPYNAPLSIHRRDQTFIAPFWFRPGGEMHAILDAIRKHRPGLTPEDITDLETLRTFWDWIYNGLHDSVRHRVAEEFAFPIGEETHDYPQVYMLTSADSRLQFVLDKAARSNAPRVCDMAPSTDKRIPHSAKPNSYDTFAIWVACMREIRELPWSLLKPQVSEYLAKRWLPWRRAPNIRSAEFSRYWWQMTQAGQGKPPLEEIDQALQFAQTTFGPAYTAYC